MRFLIDQWDFKYEKSHWLQIREISLINEKSHWLQILISLILKINEIRAQMAWLVQILMNSWDTQIECLLVKVSLGEETLKIPCSHPLHVRHAMDAIFQDFLKSIGLFWWINETRAQMAWLVVWMSHKRDTVTKGHCYQEALIFECLFYQRDTFSKRH